jgi:RND family efflux transporter MFP subunit
MSRREGVVPSGLVAGLLSLAACGLAGCEKSGGAKTASKPEIPAKVTGAPKETELATVTLTPDAEKRLGVKVAEIERKPVSQSAIYPGEVVIPSGRLLAVTSPFVGMIRLPTGTQPPEPGTAVKEGQPIFELIPILSPEAKAQIAPLLIEAEGTAKQAEQQLAVAKIDLDRAEGLLRDKLGSTASVVDARGRYDLAQTALKNAKDRLATLNRVAADAEKGVGNVQTITSPTSGVLQNTHAMTGQKVAAGAALFEVANLDPIWVKVPVFVGDMKKLARDKPATIGGLADPAGVPGERPGTPVAAPPAADPLAATVSVYYSVENKDGSLNPGERVGVVLPMKGEAVSLAAPKAALIWDIHGGSWVYEKVGEHAYARRRVVVDRVVGNLAVLANGPKVGSKVVTDGAAEIHGAEFGNGK